MDPTGQPPDNSALRARVGRMHHPLSDDVTPFGAWLRSQARRNDPVGALARVAAQDPYWPGGDSRAKVRDYFVSMGAREFVLKSVSAAWAEFDKVQRRQRARDKRAMSKQARKVQQKASRRRKGR